jgi:hypothetical protein
LGKANLHHGDKEARRRTKLSPQTNADKKDRQQIAKIAEIESQTCCG